MHQKLRLVVAVLTAASVVSACGGAESAPKTPQEPPLAATDFAATERPGSRPIGAPREVIRSAPGAWVDEARDFTSLVQEVAEASITNEDVWASTDQLETLAVVYEPFIRRFDATDVPQTILDQLEGKALDGAKVITSVASVFPPDGQPTDAPFIYKAAWEIEPREDDDPQTSDTTAFRLVLWAGYDVPRAADESPVVVGRTFEFTISNKPDGGRAFNFQIGSTAFVNSLCSRIVDGYLRPTSRPPEQFIDVLRADFATDDLTKPDEVITLAAQAVDADTESNDGPDAQECLADAS